MNKFIVFEGGEGTGKSTMAKRLADTMKDNGRKVWLTEEPGKDVVGVRKKFRDLAFDPYLRAKCPIVNTMAFFQDRALHSATIKDSLLAGDVVCDRYDGSTFAYQIADNAINFSEYGVLRELVKPVRPDIYIWLDGDPAKCLARAKQADGHHGTFEESQLAFHEAVRHNYIVFFSSLHRWSAPAMVIRVNDVHEHTPDEIFQTIITNLVAGGIDLRDYAVPR